MVQINGRLNNISQQPQVVNANLQNSVNVKSAKAKKTPVYQGEVGEGGFTTITLPHTQMPPRTGEKVMINGELCEVKKVVGGSRKATESNMHYLVVAVRCDS